MRKLRADEIEARVATVSEKGCSLLLYKDARVDMRLLDEEYGQMNWQRHHEVIDGNLYCTISIWNSEKECWVEKQDVGVESYTEKEKGQASDSFKRAGFNWGIGRELYTAPFIWISAQDVRLVDKNGKKTTYDHFTVRDIGYDGDKINKLEIYNDSMKKVVYTFGKLTSAPTKEQPKEQPKEDKKYVPNLTPKEGDQQKPATIGQITQIEKICTETGVPTTYVAQAYKVEKLSDLTRIQAYSAVNNFQMIQKKYEEDLEGIPFV